MICIDGRLGEGGGQVLRSCVALAAITGRAIELHHIRSTRSRPGLQPQHLAAVRAAAAICNAAVTGDDHGSRELTFAPGRLQAGDYRVDIGTAGSASLVLQTLALPLALAGASSTVSVTGGTHVPQSPCYEHLAWGWAPALRCMGVKLELKLSRAGFYPRGGGELNAYIQARLPLQSVHWERSTPLRRVRGLSAVAGGLPLSIAQRQAEQCRRRLSVARPRLAPELAERQYASASKGTVVALAAEHEHATAAFTALGAKGKPAERVADEAVDALLDFLERGTSVDVHLADQLILPMAFAQGRSVLSTAHASTHLRTQIELIRMLLSLEASVSSDNDCPARVTVVGAPWRASSPRVR